MGQHDTATTHPDGGFGRLLLALTTLILIASGARAQTLSVSKSRPPLSPAETISYISDHYKSGAAEPNLTFNIRYSAPLLTVTWQAQATGPGEAPGRTVVNHAQIDLRYARFSVWNTGGTDNTIIVDCAEAYFCYREPNKHQKFSHGDLDYNLTTYAARHVVRAFNYLASLNAANRPTDPFGASSMVAASGEPGKSTRSQ